MPRFPQRLSKARDWLNFGPNQIALSSAIRGTIATASPLIVMQLAGYPTAGLLMAIAGLQTSIADAGGPYRDRLLAMGSCMVLMPVTFFAGTQLHGTWWASALIMFVIASAAGLARALGQIGTSLGLILSIVFLVGTYLASPPLLALEQASFYSAGALWTILVALLFWRMRPYKRLELEVATVLGEVATLVGLASKPRERLFRAQQRAVRDAVERARLTLGETRSMAAGANPTTTRLLVLLRTSSRLTVAALDLRELCARLPDGDLRQAIEATLNGLEQVTRRIAAALMRGRQAPNFQALDARVQALSNSDVEGVARTARDHAVAVVRQALRHLDNATEALELLFGREHRLPGWLLPPLNVAERGTDVGEVLRSHINRRSIFFRHGLRVGVAAGIATAIYGVLGLRHGFWLPMTTLIILQPEFGTTLSRALTRTGGTLAGVLIAGGLLALHPATSALNAAIVLFAFFSFLLLRRNYGMAVACITPLVILLLDLFEPGAWQLLYLRGIDTLAGAALALGCSYWLWPMWERVRLPDQVARALRAEASYVQSTLEAVAGGSGLSDEVLAARREAEIQAGNADAAFQRMLTEPRRHRRTPSRYFVTVTYLLRLSRHLGALVARLEADLPPLPELRPVAAPLCAILEEAARDVAGEHADRNTAAYSETVFQQSLHALRARMSNQADSSLASIDKLLNAVISDVNSLRDAVDLD